jgi:hypothetical protein
MFPEDYRDVLPPVVSFCGAVPIVLSDGAPGAAGVDAGRSATGTLSLTAAPHHMRPTTKTTMIAATSQRDGPIE